MQLEALDREWANNPPVHYLVAAYLGYEAPTRAQADESVEEVHKALSDAMVIRSDVPAIDTSAFDAAFAATGESVQNQET